MENAERLMFMGWSELPQFKRKIEQSIEIIKRSLEIGNPGVAISWGTDSINMLHLIQQVVPDVEAYCIGDSLEDLQNNYSEVVKQYCDRFPTKYTRILYHEERDGGFYDQVNKISSQFDLTFIGIRADESPKRKMVVSKYGVIHQYQSGKKKGTWRSFPLAWWGWKDKWAYTVLHDLPYLKSYDHQASGHRSKSRTAVVHNFDLHRGSHQDGLVRHGAFSQLRLIAPDYYSMYADLYPEIKSKT